MEGMLGLMPIGWCQKRLTSIKNRVGDPVSKQEEITFRTAFVASLNEEPYTEKTEPVWILTLGHLGRHAPSFPVSLLQLCLWITESRLFDTLAPSGLALYSRLSRV